MCIDALKKYFFSMKNGYGNFWVTKKNVWSLWVCFSTVFNI